MNAQISGLNPERIVLPGGLRVLFLPIADARSATVGVWVAAGSRHESENERGVSHFIEHMLFKGTARRSARDISEEMDLLGGGLNAFTARENTHYYAHTLAENAEKAMDILCDMLTAPRLDAGDIVLERGVILDEIAMYEDCGDEVAADAMFAAVWPSSQMGSPICGTPETVSSLCREDMVDYMRRHYTPERMVAVVAGGFDRNAMLELLSATLDAIPRGKGMPVADVPEFVPAVVLTKKEFEQTSLIVAMPGYPRGDSRRYAMSVLNYITGGGASSRLFQRLREELGLAYSVYSSNYPGIEAGIFTISASFSADRQEQVLHEIDAVLDDITRNITGDEFERARAQVKASIIIGMETVSSKAGHIGQMELFEQRQREPSEILAALDALTLSEVNALANELFNAPRAVSVAGDIKSQEFYAPFCHTLCD